jgi:DNA-binding transcriptional MerR regulator
VPDRAYLSIGEVLSLLRPEFPDLTISKIRFLESQGLLDPERTPSGYRKFYDQDVDRLRWILRQQREQYLPLKVIKGRLGMDTSGDPDLDDEHEQPMAVAALSEVVEERMEPAPAPTPLMTPPVRRLPAPAPPTEGMENPLDLGESGVSLTLEELASATGLTPAHIADLERYGLIAGRPVARTTYFDEEALTVANLCAAFMRFGVEARHLRMYKTAAEREAGFFEQLVMPMLKQRNPQSRRQAMETLVELAKLGQGMRSAMLRQALRDHTG